MKIKLVLLLTLTIIVGACNKGKYTTVPQLFFKSVNTTTLTNNGEDLIFKFDFTDKEGDLDSLYVKRVTKVCSDTSNNGFLLTQTNYAYKVPDFPATSNQKGEMNIAFVYNIADSGLVSLSACISLDGSRVKTDTSSFRFCLKDRAGHLSDTIQSPPIVFLK